MPDKDGEDTLADRIRAAQAASRARGGGFSGYGEGEDGEVDAFAASFRDTREDEARSEARVRENIQAQGANYRERADKAREVARQVAATGARFHTWSTSVLVEVGPTVDGFDAEGWRLEQFTSHFRDFNLGVGLSGAAEVLRGRQERRAGRSSGPGTWNTTGDVYTLLFSRRSLE